MANSKYDGVVEAVHYAPDGQVEWARVFLRRGPTWSDHMILPRQELIREIKSGRKLMIGKRVEYMAGTFEVTDPVNVVGSAGKEALVTSNGNSDRDKLEGVPVL